MASVRRVGMLSHVVSHSVQYSDTFHPISASTLSILQLFTFSYIWMGISCCSLNNEHDLDDWIWLDVTFIFQYIRQQFRFEYSRAQCREQVSWILHISSRLCKVISNHSTITKMSLSRIYEWLLHEIATRSHLHFMPSCFPLLCFVSRLSHQTSWWQMAL